MSPNHPFVTIFAAMSISRQPDSLDQITSQEFALDPTSRNSSEEIPGRLESSRRNLPACVNGNSGGF